MLERVDVGDRTIDAYRGVAPGAILDELRDRAATLREVRVLHLNATPYGGGVSELLRSVVPLLNDLGLVADWKIIGGDEAFFKVTKQLHNGLQGADGQLTLKQKQLYLETSQKNADLLKEPYDVVFVHDPQPLAIPSLKRKNHSRWVWRCHVDTSKPNADIWNFLRGYLDPYDAAVFTMDEFVPADFPVDRVEIMPPAIDPLSPKNLDMPREMARQILDWIGVVSHRPLVTQVARFDSWKDPEGVIEAYRLARNEFPDLQLALVGSMALDDPEGWEVYHRIQDAARGDSLVHVFTNLTGVGNIEVNAFQRISELVIQKSVREGFGLVVAEAMWKGTPVVAGRAGGIPLQVIDNVGGILVDSVEQCAEAIVALMRNERKRRELGESGRERVREHFLLPRLLLNHVILMQELFEQRPIMRMPSTDETCMRDPVCGMAIASENDDGLTAEFRGRTFHFCSEACRRQFLNDPSHYVAEPNA